MITSYNQIDLAGSPVYCRIPKFITGTPIRYVLITLRVWQGSYDRSTITKEYYIPPFYREFYSATELFIDVAPYIQSILNSDYYYYGNNLTIPMNELCFWQVTSVEVDMNYNNVPGTSFNNGIRAATLGYDWRYEVDRTYLPINGGDGFDSVVDNLFWIQGVKYFRSQINLNVATSQQMVTRVETPLDLHYLTCVKEPYIVVYRNKQGLWSQFTPTGKVVQSSEISGDKYLKTYSKSTNAYLPYNQPAKRINIVVEDTFTINTGVLTPDMVDVIEEIVYSDCVFLVRFNPNVTPLPVTIDSTITTIDNTNITIDAVSSTSLYTDFEQIAVVIDETNFIRKNNYNDKGKVNYTIKYKASAPKKRI